MSDVVQSFNNLAYSKKEEGQGRVKLSIEVENERFKVALDNTYKKLAPSVKISGFRPGKAPENLTKAQLGAQLYEKTLNSLLPTCTLEVLKRENLKPLDQISYKVEKVAEGSGVKYTAEFTVLPDFELPDFSKIKAKKEKTEVTDEEVETVINQMYTQSQEAKKEKKKDEKKKEGKKGEKKDKEKKKKDKKQSDKPTDEWAKTLDLDVKNMDQLRKRVKSELERQKKTMQKDKYLSEILTQVADKSKFEVPSLLVEKEVERRWQQYRGRIEKLGMKVEDFLRNQKTSKKELEKNWKKEARKVLKNEIIIMKVAEKEDIKVTDEEIEKHVNSLEDEKLKENYKSPQAKQYLRNVLFRQKVIDKILELVEGEK